MRSPSLLRAAFLLAIAMDEDWAAALTFGHPANSTSTADFMVCQ